MIARSLNTHFKGDQRSLKAAQQGRLPGSTNIKQGKGNMTQLVHSMPRSHLDEQAFLSLTAHEKVVVHGDDVSVRVVPPRVTKPGSDRSGGDWKMCCDYFEANPQATVEQGKQDLAGKLTKDQQVFFTSRRRDFSTGVCRKMKSGHVQLRQRHQDMSRAEGPNPGSVQIWIMFSDNVTNEIKLLVWTCLLSLALLWT
jgi:hypothetical protein